MGQAAVLPDPLNEPASPPASADELLSQLVGDEINRLLAESETECASLPRSGAAEDHVPAVSSDVDLGALARHAAEEATANVPAQPPAPSAAVAPPPVAPEIATGTAEREALRDELVESLPFYLKPLEWLNAPLHFLSERMREALGKVAIVTLVNAIAVLLYAILFRKH